MIKIKRVISIVVYSTLIILFSSLVVSAQNVPSVLYQVYIQDSGWSEYSRDGNVSGTTGKAKRIEAIRVKSDDPNIKISYKTHFQNKGWTDWVNNNDISGFPKQGLRLEAIQIKLVDNNEYNIEYKAHVEKNGWMNWVKDGEVAGITGNALRLEAIQIKIKLNDSKVIRKENINWVGSYEFQEDAGRSQFWIYTLRIFEYNDTLFGDFAGDGHIMLMRIRCICLLNEETGLLDICYYLSLPEDMNPDEFTKGDILFSFSNDSKSIRTFWDKFQPNVIDNQKQGFIRFKKVLD